MVSRRAVALSVGTGALGLVIGTQVGGSSSQAPQTARATEDALRVLRRRPIWRAVTSEPLYPEPGQIRTDIQYQELGLPLLFDVLTEDLQDLHDNNPDLADTLHNRVSVYVPRML